MNKVIIILAMMTLFILADDIKLSDIWKTEFFFGITLDTRIFNKVLSRN